MSQPSRSSLHLLLALALISLACFAVPLYVIRPFRHQGETELQIALFVKQIGPWLSTTCVAFGLVLVVFAWRRMRGWIIRSAACFALLLAIGGAYLARLNVYELMFHPLGRPQFLSSERARLDGDDMVIAVRRNGIFRAYPVGEIAYHHVVNDTLAEEPVVATY